MRTGDTDAAPPLARKAAALLGAPLSAWQRLAGGDLSAVLHLRLADGRVAVAKTGPDPRAEAKMLDAIRAAGAPAPAVLAVSERVLVIEALDEGAGLSAPGWAALGAALRRMHATRGDGYGWPTDYAFGPVRIANAAAPDWPAFWAERRLLPNAAVLPAPFARRLEALARRLPDLLPRHPVAGLLHGDLWPGNLVAAPDGRLAGLIDPACCRGHGEVDLAMLHLFGRPGPAFIEAYAPAGGWQDRLPIYQVWPAIVHVRLFGAGYHGMLDAVLSRAGV